MEGGLACGCQGKRVEGGLQTLTFRQNFQVQHSKSRVASTIGRNISQDQLNTTLPWDPWLGVLLTLGLFSVAGWLCLWLYLPVADSISGFFPCAHSWLSICTHTIFTQFALTHTGYSGVSGPGWSSEGSRPFLSSKLRI